MVCFHPWGHHHGPLRPERADDSEPEHLWSAGPMGKHTPGAAALLQQQDEEGWIRREEGEALSESPPRGCVCAGEHEQKAKQNTKEEKGKEKKGRSKTHLKRVKPKLRRETDRVEILFSFSTYTFRM